MDRLTQLMKKRHDFSVGKYCVTLVIQFSSVQSLSHVQSLQPIDCSMPGLPVHHQLPDHLILCRPLLLLPSIFPSNKVFSNESVFQVRLPKYWSFSISPSNEYSFIEDNCFTILCWFLLCINTNQPKVYICPLPLELFHLPLL